MDTESRVRAKDIEDKFVNIQKDCKKDEEHLNELHRKRKAKR